MILKKKKTSLMVKSFARSKGPSMESYHYVDVFPREGKPLA